MNILRSEIEERPRVWGIILGLAFHAMLAPVLRCWL